MQQVQSVCVWKAGKKSFEKKILQTVSTGSFIELENLTSIPLNTSHKTEKLCSDPEKMLFMKEISRLLQKSAIKQVKISEKSYVSSIFLREKKSKTTHRLILNLEKFNENVVYQHFKINSLSTVLNMVKKDCYNASVDFQMYTIQYLYYVWTKNTCSLNLREIYANTHAYQITSHQLKEYLPKFKTCVCSSHEGRP